MIYNFTAKKGVKTIIDYGHNYNYSLYLISFPTLLFFHILRNSLVCVSQDLLTHIIQSRTLNTHTHSGLRWPNGSRIGSDIIIEF